MKQFVITGGERTDPRVAESYYTFEYPLFAANRQEAVEQFHTIFPGIDLVAVK
jgi:hypothetical protein